MAWRSPQAIYDVWDAIHEGMPRAVLSGILGDAAHFAEGGYHVPRNACPAGDYSCQLPEDHLGKGDCASALDISLPPDLMVTVSKRLLAAGKNNDPRLHALREFFGTVDGVKVTGWDRHDPDKPYDDTYTWSDNSHLWHIHLSFYREFADNAEALLPIVEVFLGLEADTLPDAQEVAVAVKQAVIAKDGTTIASALRQILAATDPEKLSDLVVSKLQAAGVEHSLTKADVEAAVKAVFADAAS